MLTFHRCVNYGSYWQARALVEGLRDRGFEAVILDHRSERVDLREWRCALQPTLPSPTTAEDRRSYATKARRSLEAVAQLPHSAAFPLSHPEQAGVYDAVVIGSDEVWNLHHPWYGGWPAFFGEGFHTDRLVAHAASCGTFDGAGVGEEWRARLRRFDAISVRDHHAERLVRDSIGFEPTLVLDPCLQFGVCAPEPGRGEFVAVYGHNFSPGFAASVQDAAHARGLRTLSVGYRNPWADEHWIDASPDDFAAVVGAADAVATNFFHGCVFALGSEKPFVAEAVGYRWGKVYSLLTLLGAQAHLAGEAPPSEFARLLDTPPAPAVLQSVAALRATSDEFLDVALG